MQILLIDEWFPYPPDSGKKIRTYNLLRHLVRAGTVVYLYHGTNEPPSIPKCLQPGIRLVPVLDERPEKRSRHFYWRVFLNVFQGMPFAAAYASTKAMAAALDAVLAENQFDVVACEWTPYAHYLHGIEHPARLIMSHNIEFLQWKRLCRATRNPFVSVLAWLQWHKMARYEAAHFRTVRSLVVVSDTDRSLALSLAPGVDTCIVPNGVDLEYFRPSDVVPEAKRMVFSASMDAFSNEDGACFFVDEILPLVQAAEPDASFVIVGRCPGKRTLALRRRQGVTVTGSVDDVRPFIAMSGVAVVPLRVGGGTRLKILEAMAMGIPVVSTSVGAEGLDVRHETHLLVADAPADFARQVIRCMRDPVLRDRLIRQGLGLVRDRYSWEAIGDGLVQHLRAVLGDVATRVAPGRWERPE